jgi:hypothetical protein
MRRKWIKVYVDQCLRGTMTEELEPAERWVWFGLLLLAGDSPIEGKIAISPNIGFEDHQLAELLHVDLKLFKKAKNKCIEFDKIRILPNNILEITNWKKYQSEYRRQKPYRQEKEEESPGLSKEERLENGDRRGEIGEQKVTPGYNEKLQQKVTKEEELPPIPKTASFEKIREFERIRNELKRLENMKNNEQERHYHNLTEEKIQEKIEGYIELYLKELRAYQ